jgi:hypothetical protein
VTVETRHLGAWALSGDVIETQITSGEFLSSDGPLITVAAGQAALDAQLERKPWSKHRVLSFGDQLVVIPIETMHEQAAVQVTCTKV